MASDFEDFPSSTSSYTSVGTRQEVEIVQGIAKTNPGGAACNNGSESSWDIRFEARTLFEDSAARIEEEWPWYETLGLQWGGVLNKGDRVNDDNPPVDAVLAFNVKINRIAPAHERSLEIALEALKEVLVAIHNVSNAVRDDIVELVGYCVGATRGALEAARREEMPQPIAQALGNIRAEIEWVENFARTYRTVRTGCCRRATLSERDRRRAVAHKEKLHKLLNLVLTALAAQSNGDRNKLVSMLNDGAGVGDGSGLGLGSWSGKPPNGDAAAEKLAGVPREAPVLPPTYVESLAAVERVVLDLIDPARAVPSAHCLVGPEGSGKTLLASEVVRDRRVRNSFRDGIFWFTAGRDSTAADAALFLERVARDLAGAASRGTAAARPRHPQPHPHRLRYRRFSSSEVGGNLRCLVVLDDAWDTKVVEAFASAGFHALVTTRRREVIPRASGGLYSELGEMQRGEAIELLRRASGASKPLPEVEAVQVAEVCAILPLALSVAGALARDDPLEAATWQRLHDELLAKRTELLDPEPEPEHVAPVFAAVCAGLCRLPEAQRGQFRLLAVMSLGAIATTDMLANLWDTEVGDVRACADLLVDRGLLQAVPEGYRLDGTVLDYLRRTVQLTATNTDDADCPPPSPSKLASARQARYLSRPELLRGQHSSVDLCSLVGLWRAAKRVAGLGGEVIVVERCYADSLGVLGVAEELPCWREAGRVVGLLAEYEGAERMLEKALAISEERVEGEDDLEDVATALKDLGRALESQGQLEDANRVYARAIEVGERALSAHHGRDHNHRNPHHYPGHPLDQWSPMTPRDDKEMYEGAVLLYQRAIETGERVLGPDHPDLASRLNNLAELLRDQGKYDEAEPLYERSQAIRERALGPCDPVVATSLNSRAELLRARGEYARAEPLTMRAQAILEKSEGADHPDVAITVTNRATLLEAQGKYVNAEPLRMRAIEIWEKIHGPDHELVATALGGRAGALRHQGKYADAEALYKRAAKIWTHICGPDHPRVATALNNRAAVLKAQGKYVEADPLYVRSIKIGEETLGAGHPTVATRLGNRARLLAAQGNPEEAVRLLERAVAIRRNALGDFHKGTITFRRALESIRKEQISASE